MIISLIIYLLKGKRIQRQDEQIELTDKINIAPQIIPQIVPQLQPQPQPQLQPQPQQQINEESPRKRKAVRFTPTIDVRAFNINDGEIIEQYTRQI